MRLGIISGVVEAREESMTVRWRGREGCNQVQVSVCGGLKVKGEVVVRKAE